MTDYSTAAEAEVQRPDPPAITTIPTRGHRPVVEWRYPEFQCLCPLSDRHDQGVLTLRYRPREHILESKAVRDYLRAWRNLHTWQEFVTDEIATALAASCEPEWLSVTIEWTPRGGIYATTRAERGNKSG